MTCKYCDNGHAKNDGSDCWTAECVQRKHPSPQQEESMDSVCPICYGNGYTWLGSELCTCPIGQEIQDRIDKREENND